MDMKRRQLLSAVATSAASVGVVGGTAAASPRNIHGGLDDTCGERDYQCQGSKGYQYSETVERGPACGFANRVVFPILTAASMEDGIPVSTKTVATGWAASSTACYALDQMEDVHGNVDAATVYIRSDDDHTLMMPR